LYPAGKYLLWLKIFKPDALAKKPGVKATNTVGRQTIIPTNIPIIKLLICLVSKTVFLYLINKAIKVRGVIILWA